MKTNEIPPLPSRKDVVTLAAQNFRAESSEFIMGIVDLYGVEPNEPHREFVQVAILHYAEGDVEKLLRLVEDAKRDYQACLYREAFASNALATALEEQGWEFFVLPNLPPTHPVTKEGAAQLLKVNWKQIDEWVERGELKPKLKPISKRRGQYRFAIEELARFQRESEPEVDIAANWAVS